MVPFERVCECCGKAFLVKSHLLQRFCTLKCQQRGSGFVHADKERACKQCGVSFSPYDYRNIFCSRECLGRNFKGLPPFKKERPCGECGKIFTSTESKQHFCSKKCRCKFYFKEHHEEYSAYRDRRRARKAGAQGSYTASEFELICKKQSGKCAHCKKKCKLTMDHIMPLAAGGTNYAFNLQGLCLKCNLSKNDKILPYAHPSLFDNPAPV